MAVLSEVVRVFGKDIARVMPIAWHDCAANNPKRERGRILLVIIEWSFALADASGYLIL